ncbi:MAG: hypothetical protein WAL38_04325 [Solirubrobacteraceae bacterium]
MSLPDEQQALVLNALRTAAGRPVSFSELRQAGVEFPASIVSELELSGIAIQRCRVSGGREPGVRLVLAAEPPAEPAPEPAPAPTSEPIPNSTAAPAPAPLPTKPTFAAEPSLAEDDWTRVSRYRASPREGLLLAVLRPKRLLAPAALVFAIVVVVAIVLTATGLGAGSSPRHERIAQRQRSRPATATTTTHATSTTSATTTTTATAQAPTPPPTPVSLTLAAQLESQGHDLLTGGQYTAAVPILKRAMAATGEHVSACVDPDSTMCLTYAYALYDLGRALRLSGDPTAAVPILEARLQIDNQRPTVMAELALARQGAT